MSASAIQASSVSTPAAAPEKVADGPGFSFHDLLSALNPLQYLPVVGTIYRAATGDVIPDGVRYAGSMIVSGLLGGPVGVITNIAVTLAEKATGIDPEKLVAGLFKGTPQASDAPPAQIETPDSDAKRFALSPQQLAAYGVHTDPLGTLQLGDIHGADVLNVIELARINKVHSVYAANQTIPPSVAMQAS